MIPVKRVTLTQKWGQTGFAKKIARQERRAELTDFERFQVMVLKRQVGKSMRKWLKTQRKSILQG